MLCSDSHLRSTLLPGTLLAIILQLIASNAHADKVWLKDDSTIVAQFTVTSGYPHNESCLFSMSMPTDGNGGMATFSFTLLQAMPVSPFSYTDKAAQWSNKELIQLLVDGNKPIANLAHLDDYHGLSGLLTIPSSHLAEQMFHGHTLTVTTRAGERTFPISTDAVVAFQKCAHAFRESK
jgi:hypothetical protein